MSKEITIPAIVIILALAFLDPFMVLMPSPLVLMLLTAFLIIALLYAVFVWKEQAADEREYALRAYAGRLSFITGAVVLAAGIIYQALTVHAVDPFLILTLVLMVLAKQFGHLYTEK